MPIWAGILIDVAFIICVALLAIFYPWIWYDLFQRNEPFTQQWARIAQKRPWFFYGLCGLLLVGAFAGAILIEWWAWRVIHVIVVGFFAWLLPHVWAAAQDPNNPPHYPFITAARRLFKKVLKHA
jgi:hypothetical protein